VSLLSSAAAAVVGPFFALLSAKSRLFTVRSDPTILPLEHINKNKAAVTATEFKNFFFFPCLNNFEILIRNLLLLLVLLLFC
jgi:hypothetical protein